jgi:hypothetical protein
MCYICFVARKNAIANVSLPPEIHAWVKGKIAAILESEPAANPTFTSVVSDALRRKMNEEKKRAKSQKKKKAMCNIEPMPQPAIKVPSKPAEKTNAP